MTMICLEKLFNKIMKKLIVKYFTFLLLLITFTANAQVENSHGKSPYSFAPDFFIDFAQYVSDTEGKTRIDAFLQIPYANLQFIKIKDGYQSRYKISILIMDEDKERRLDEISWKERVFVKKFEATNSSRNAAVSLKSFNLKPGDYYLKCSLEDLDSEKISFFNVEYKVQEFSRVLSMSEIVLIDKKVKTAGGEQIIPNISRKVDKDNEFLEFFYEIYSDSEKNVTVDYLIYDVKREMSFTTSILKSISAGRNILVEKLKDFELKLGEFKLTLTLKDGSDELDIRHKTFNSIIYGFPITITDLDKAISQLKYIATTTEEDYIVAAENYDERLQRFIDFWKVKDPSPGTVENEMLFEYYRRVAYADEHFDSYYDGWRTDMGMIYITLGPPSQVDRHPFSDSGKPYEIWTYYEINRDFIFIDQTGFGDYRLYRPVYGDWYRYRQ